MNKFFFRALVFLMSVSLIGIIAIQVYWFNTSWQNNQEQFKFHVKQVLGSVSETLQQEEIVYFIDKLNQIKDSIGSEQIDKQTLEFGYYQKNSETNETIIYSNSLVSRDFNIPLSFFDKNNDSLKIKSLTSKRSTSVFHPSSIDKVNQQIQVNPDLKIEKSGSTPFLDKIQYEMSLKDIASTYPIQRRIKKEELQKLLKKTLTDYGVNTPFEFGIYSNSLATKVRSENFKFNKENTYSIPILEDNDGESKYDLLVSFPDKKKYFFSDLIGVTVLSLVFTLIIVIAYSSALNQLMKQRQISEIKTDFINNMTHEFKTPIATINLALDSIKNPKIINDTEKVHRYLQMIRDENKRMHAQVENVLRISKLEKKELEIIKEPLDVHDLIQDAMDHVSLIMESRDGQMNAHLDASRSTVLLNDVHFTNVLVNMLDNAIKYSPNQPKVEITTENIKDFIIIKIKDEGLGMSKAAQKRIFEKFYREHTGDLHNVKGHGLGLAYVKRMVEEHNGEVFVESEKGKGSTFIIKIPLIN
ncbi:MAG: sensor histidine kinase [Flavobacterium sp.]|jgi:two-component system phosphate regulon sensor histidine kinase PhoR